MRTRNTIRVSPTSESSRPGASGQDHTLSSMYDSTMVVSEKNTLFLPQELKLGGPSNWEQYCPAQKAILRINGLEDAVFGDYPPEEQQTMDQKIRAAKAAVSIRGNCTGEALSQLVGIENPQEMFNLLQAYSTRAIDGLTPMESFLNEALPGQDNKPDLSGERICGSQVTIHIPQERRLRSHKFGPRGEAGIYLCMEGSQIYTCWVPSRRKGHQIVRSANVKFYERVRETELLTETEHDVEPEIRKNGAPISSRPQSVTEQTKTPSPQRPEVNNLQHAELSCPISEKR
ncbi:hypothetical protein FOFC_16098 [Fusarium oxysporum]|nr:hypothetical protein FOFC_16098 [Fusarium oxysporum]